MDLAMPDRLTLPIGWEARIDRSPGAVLKQDRIKLGPQLVIGQHDEPDPRGGGAGHPLTVRGDGFGAHRAVGEKTEHQRERIVDDDHRRSFAEHRLPGRRVPPPNLDDLITNRRIPGREHLAQLIRYTRAHSPNGHVTKVELGEDNIGASLHVPYSVCAYCRFGLLPHVRPPAAVRSFRQRPAAARVA